MREIKMNFDQSLYVDTENKSVTSGMVNTVQEIKIDKSNTDVHGDKGGKE